MERFETENDALKHIRYRFGHMMNGIVMAYSSIDFNSYNIIIKPFLKEIMITSNKEHSQYVISAITHHGSNFVNTTIDGDSLLNNLKKWLAENGYAPLAGICISGSSVSTIEDRGYRSWNTAAHELGHNLGSEHDGIGNSQDCDPNENYIMRPGGGYVKKENYKNSYIFSSCSVIAMKNVIYGNSFNGFPRVCLFNTVCHHDVSDEDLSQMPGEMFDLDRQCQIYFGEGSSKCSFDHVSDNCYAPFCQIDENNCKSLPYGSILEGTHCGDNKVSYEYFENLCDINQITISLSCKERLFFNNDRTVPIDCENYYDNCDNLVKAKQFICFTKDFSTRCCKACHEKGFYLSDNFTNMVTNTDASSTTTPTLTTSKYYTSPITTYRTSTTSPLTTNDFTGTIPTSTNSIGNTHSSFTSTLTYLRSTYTSPIISND
ncbi:hypothetical protein A3Q56_04685 [Intoshia linei]|uniref:Peptidase M12B domain-containing protein n=1 Tax=Intoshia linei TaxID=1819745 RepID=A0A177B019_9BILA|nr:hypothetical protein A3Q56_04685 [Intoshia linei]